MRTSRFVVVLACAGGMGWATPAVAQQIICCAEIVGVGGNWTGASRLENCQQYLDQASPSILQRMCEQRAALSCLDTSRCNTLPMPETAPEKRASTGDAPLPPDPDRDGLADGFGVPPPRGTTAPPPPPGLSPPRLVYLVRARSSGGDTLTAFTVHLDGNACAMPLAANGQPTNPAAVERVVRGRVTRSEGRVAIDAEAVSRDGVVLAKATGSASGTNRASVATATRAATKALNLVCAR